MNENDPVEHNRNIVLKLATDIVTAYAGKAKLSPAELVTVIGSVSRSLSAVAAGAAQAASDAPVPAVPIKKSVTPDFLICLEDGKKLKMLKRHLRVVYRMNFAEYRAKWNLPHDYPSVAPNYAARRSALAKQVGLGHRQPGSGKPRGRPRKAPAA